MKVRIEGPYYGNYSLSIINRSLAIALAKKHDVDVSISATSAENWKRDQDQEKILYENYNIKYIDARSTNIPDYVIRNTWPINGENLHSEALNIRYFFWEELLVPDYIIDCFNKKFDAIFSPSDFVKRALLGSGLKKPVFILPSAVDNIYSFYPPEPNDRCNFFHNSSCFPRKLTDLLVKAFIKEFNICDDVSLTIKSFWNPHNTINKVIEDEKQVKPDSPSINYIEADLSEAELLDLYTNAHYFVFPSKGEGYGLPPEEAHAVGRPVIMPKSTALTERFIEFADISLDFEAHFASSHLASPYSVWFEPKFSSVTSALRLAYEEWKSFESLYINRVNFLKNSTINRWSDITEILYNHLLDMVKGDLKLDKNKKHICIISTFNQKCGVATYISSLLSNYTGSVKETKFTVLAPIIMSNDELLDFDKGLSDFDVSVIRCWDYWSDVFVSISKYIEEFEFDEIYIQHHTAFFSINQLDSLLKLIAYKNIRCKITLHSLFQQDVDVEHGSYVDLIKNRGCDNCFFYVHSLREYKNGLCSDFLFILPHGVDQGRGYSEFRPSMEGVLGNSYMVASFGFLRRHKGIRELISAWPYVTAKIPDANLLLLTSRHPAPDSDEEVNYCRGLISRLELGNSVSLITEHLQSETIEGLLSYVDCVVFPYHEINEGASGAVRQAVSSASAIVVSEASVFEEFRDTVMRVDCLDPILLANAMIKLIENRSIREKFRAKSKKLRSLLSWTNVANVYWF